jgi:hypothetical protein
MTQRMREIGRSGLLNVFEMVHSDWDLQTRTPLSAGFFAWEDYLGA